MTQRIRLKRSLSLPMMVLYGLGTTIGAGIYALVGEVASVAGYFAPISFLIASLMACFAAAAFAELSARFPQAAGVALYVRQAFGAGRLSTIVGLLVVVAGLVSSAALVNGFVGYLYQFIEIERPLAIILVTIVLGGITIWGIAESVTIASVITAVEIGGLMLVIAVNGDALLTFSDRWTQLVPASDIAGWGGIYAGVALAFYAFIGFEDMVDVAEEVKDVQRNLPISILLTLIVTTLVYVLLMTTAVLTASPSELAASEAPIAFLYEVGAGQRSVLIGVIGMFAIINGALIQLIMASRVLYGLSSRGQLPNFLSEVSARTRTPVFATIVAAGFVLIIALVGGLASLAELTSLIILTVFSLVNLALWQVKKRDPHPAGVRTVPFWMPVTGAAVSITFVVIDIVVLLY